MCLDRMARGVRRWLVAGHTSAVFITAVRVGAALSGEAKPAHAGSILRALLLQYGALRPGPPWRAQAERAHWDLHEIIARK